MNTKPEKQPGEVGYNGERKETRMKHHFEDTPERKAIDKFKQCEPLTEEEDALLLTTEQTAEVLSFLRKEPVSTRYLPQLVRDNRLQPAAPGSGRSYLYRFSDVRQVRFGKAGVPKKCKAKADA